MGLLDKLWDDVAGGSPPEKGLKQLRKEKSAAAAPFPEGDAASGIMDRRRSAEFLRSQDEASRMTQSIAIKKPQTMAPLDTESPVGTPGSVGSTPPASPSMASPSTFAREKTNVWRSVFHPGQNKVMRQVGSDKFDNAKPNSPTVYDWLYSADTKTEYR